MSTLDILCSSSSIGRASVSQAEYCEFKPRLLLHTLFVRFLRAPKPVSTDRVTKGSIKNKRGYERYKNNNPWSYGKTLIATIIFFLGCSSSSIGRASVFRTECCEFKSRLLLQSNCGYNDNNSTLLIIFEVRKIDC